MNTDDAMSDAYEKYVASPPTQCAVCLGSFTSAQPAITKEFTGEYYAFCSSECVSAFETDPEQYTRPEEEEENEEELL
mgnify:CR=1 FL=1